MLKNYILITIRNFRKKILYSGINIFGLSVGLAAFFLILIWVQQEMNYDRFNDHADRIYRTSLKFTSNGEGYESGVAPTALLPALQNQPAVEKATLLYYPGGFSEPVIQVGNEFFPEPELYYGDSSLLDVFDIKIIAGSRDALSRPDQAMISASLARKLFGNDLPLGSTFRTSNKDFEVAAIYEDMPPASHFHASLFIPFLAHPASAPDRITWGSANYYMYAMLYPGSNPEDVRERVNDQIKRDFGYPMDAKNKVEATFFPLTDIHLKAERQTGNEAGGSVTSIYIFAAIGLLILLIACINYMNLATARATERAREVGVRKVMGAHRSQLIWQFMSESYAFVLISGIIAIGLINMLLPLFSDLVGYHYTPEMVFSGDLPLVLGGLLVLVGFISGMYPALILSSFQPERVLKSSANTSTHGAALRKGLVIVQFVITISLITGTILINKQLQFIQSKDLGYNKDQVIMMSNNRGIQQNYDYARNEFMKVSGVMDVARGSESPVSVNGGYSIHTESMGDDESLLIRAVAIDEHFLKTLDIEIVDGRGFNSGDWAMLNDTVYSFLINERAAREFFLEGEEIVGAPVNLNGRHGFVRGIVKDFHFAGLQNEIGPIVLFLEEQFSKVLVKIDTDNIEETMAGLASAWKQISPESPFTYKFLDQEYANMYSAEMRFGQMTAIFSAIAIILASLGLIGLISFIAVKKAREIGIRKVLGANVSDILVFLLGDFVRLILIAVVIASPLAYFLLKRWFDNFAYRTEIGLWPFLLGAGIAITIALLLVSFQTIRSARANPVESIRTE